MGFKKNHIDDVQAGTVNEHFHALLKCEDSIDSEPSELMPKDLPDWYDDKLFRVGQNYYKRNILSMSLAGMIGLLAVLAIPSILKILIYTKQSGTACAAFKRYLGTIIHTHNLYTSEIKDKDSNWWKSLNTIRWKHSISSRRSCKGQCGPITQRDMALTQFGFIGYALLSPRKLSLTNEPDEREGLNHFWRVLGHMLGISDSINICRKNQEETTKLCRRLLDEIYIENMKKNSEDFLRMSSILVDGVWAIDVALNYQAVVHLWYNLSDLEYVQPLSTYSWLNIQLRSFLLFSIGLPYIGCLIRNGCNQYLKMCYWLAERYPIIAIFRFGKMQSAIKLYPNMME